MEQPQPTQPHQEEEQRHTVKIALTVNEDEDAVAEIVQDDDIEHAISESISDLGSSLPIASYVIELDLPTPRYRTIRVRADHPEGEDDVGIQVKAV